MELDSKTIQAIAQAVRQQLQDGGLLLSENEAKEYRKLKAANDTKQSKLLSGVNAARILGVTSACIWKMRQRGQLKATLIGKTWKYYESDVLKIKRQTC